MELWLGHAVDFHKLGKVRDVGRREETLDRQTEDAHDQLVGSSCLSGFPLAGYAYQSISLSGCG